MATLKKFTSVSEAIYKVVKLSMFSHFIADLEILHQKGMKTEYEKKLVEYDNMVKRDADFYSVWSPLVSGPSVISAKKLMSALHYYVEDSSVDDTSATHQNTIVMGMLLFYIASTQKKGKPFDSSLDEFFSLIEESKPTLPELLATDDAMIYWQRAKDNGVVDENYQICKKYSHVFKSLFAEKMMRVLRIDSWVPFEELWNIKNLRNYIQRTQYQKNTYRFEEILQDIFY